MTDPGRAHEGGVSVALVHYTAPPVIGGVERVLGRHAVLMADAGHAVRVVAGRGEPSDPRIRFVGIPLIDSRHPRIEQLNRALDAGRVPADFPDVARALETALREALEGVDVVVAHNVCSLNFNLALTAALRRLAARAAAPRFILWHHDLAWTSPRDRPSLHDGPPWDLLKAAWPGTTQVVVSESRRAELAALTGTPAEEIVVVPNGVDVAPTWMLEPVTAELLVRSDLLAAAPLLLMPARVTPRKNIESGLHVVAAMRAAGRPAGLVVTGPVDPHRPASRAYLERLLVLRHTLDLDAVVWFLAEEMHVTPTDAVVDDLYRIADALYLPSHDEGFGLPILEAAVHRLPIVCSDLPALHDLAGDAALYVAPDGDPAAIAALVLERLESDPILVLARRIRSQYSWQAVYRQGIAPLLAPA